MLGGALAATTACEGALCAAWPLLHTVACAVSLREGHVTFEVSCRTCRTNSVGVVFAIVINGIVAVLVHWPIYVSIFSCLKCCQSSACKACVDEDDPHEDIPEGEFPTTQSELKAARKGAKHVV